MSSMVPSMIQFLCKTGPCLSQRPSIRLPGQPTSPQTADRSLRKHPVAQTVMMVVKIVSANPLVLILRPGIRKRESPDPDLILHRHISFRESPQRAGKMVIIKHDSPSLG